jgi:hypothetical protein
MAAAKGNPATKRDTDRFKQASAKQVKDRFSQAKTVKDRDRHK